jgi:hypothetical protein
MGKHAQLVIGPAGSGKSTYCNVLQKHCENTKRTVHVINLDPAAESFDYNPVADIRDLIALEDATTELDLGPNGGLVYCMEYFAQHMEWLEEIIDDFDDDYVIFDCPGQIELYSHVSVMNVLVSHLRKWGFNACVVYVLDSGLISDSSRFMAGTMMSLSAMVKLELPHINVLSKCDLLPNMRVVEDFLDPDIGSLLEKLRDADYRLLKYERKLRKKHEKTNAKSRNEKPVIAHLAENSNSLTESIHDSSSKVPIMKSTSTSFSSSEVTVEHSISQPSSIMSAKSSTLHYDERYTRLNSALASLIEEYSMVSFVPLNLKDDESVANVLLHIDTAIQYGEDLEPKDDKFEENLEEEGKWGNLEEYQ